MKTHSMQCSRCVVIVSVMTLIVSMPTWAKQENEVDLSQLRFRYEEEGLYGDIVSGGGNFSERGPYINFVVLQFGRHWPKPIGLEGALMESIMESLAEEHRAIRSWLPLGIYIPILTFDWPGGDLGMSSTLNLAARAHLLPRYNYYLSGNGSTEGVSDSASFPKFFDVCLEWRGPLHTISLGYRHQTKPFEYECGGWPHGLDMSGVFASVRVGMSWAATETVEKRLSNSLTEKIEAPYYEGEDFCNQKNFDEAMQKWEQALEIAKSNGARKWTCFLLAELGDVYREQDKYQEALSYYEQAAKIYKVLDDRKGIGRTFIDLSEEIADTYRDLGDHYYNCSDYQKARSHYAGALEIYKKLRNKAGIVRALTGLGDAYWAPGDGYGRLTAIFCYQQALDICEGAERIDDQEGIAILFGSLGNACVSNGNYPAAIHYYEQALGILTSIGDKRRVGRILGNFGAVYCRLGYYQKAIFYYERSLEIGRETKDDSGGLPQYTGLGFIYAHLGYYEKAISYYEKVLKIGKQTDDKAGIGAVLTNLGIVYEDLGDYPKALSYLEQALEINREIGGTTMRVEANIADVWLKMGEVDKAEEFYLEFGDPKRLGKLNLVKQNYRKAIEYFSGDEKSLADNKAAYRIVLEDPGFLFDRHTGLGQAYEGLKEYSKARENYKKAITLVEEQREALDVEKTKFFTADLEFFERTQPYEGMVSVLANMDDSEAFFYSENLKARVLSETIARRQSSLGHILPDSLAKEEDLYITRIRDLRNEMDELYRSKPLSIRQKEKDEKRLSLSEKEKELKEAKAKQEEFVHRLWKSCPEYASIHYPQPIKPGEVKFGSNEVLIEFEVTDDATYVFMLKQDELKTRRIAISREELRELVLQYRSFFEGITKASQLLEYKPQVGKELYALLFGDLLRSVAEESSLIIVPDEFLGILPFEALVTELPAIEKIGEGEYGPFPMGVKYLGDRYFISYAQSATALTLLRTLKKVGTSEGNVLVVADPLFSASDARLTKASQVGVSEENLNLISAIANWRQMGVAGVRRREEKPRRAVSVADEVFPRLEKTEELALEIELLFGDGAEILIGANAGEDKVSEMPLSDYRYIIFATHGILDNALPWMREPALVLTQVGNPEDYDGFLTMSEVMGLKLGAEVVALTACETGLGENVAGEGVMGMGRAFQFAGASNVLISLWSVAETSATQLTTTFFKHLREGKEPRQAIRLARDDIRRQGYEHPFYWASFILLGE